MVPWFSWFYGDRCENVSGSDVWIREYFSHGCIIGCYSSRTDVAFRWDSEKLSGIVTSQANGPRDLCSASWCLLSVRVSPGGSLMTGICAHFTALHIMSFSTECRCCLTAVTVLLRHERPWSPLKSICLPHAHVLGSHVLNQQRLWLSHCLVGVPRLQLVLCPW